MWTAEIMEVVVMDYLLFVFDHIIVLPSSTNACIKFTHILSLNATEVLSVEARFVTGLTVVENEV